MTPELGAGGRDRVQRLVRARHEQRVPVGAEVRARAAEEVGPADQPTRTDVHERHAAGCRDAGDKGVSHRDRVAGVGPDGIDAPDLVAVGEIVAEEFTGGGAVDAKPPRDDRRRVDDFLKGLTREERSRLDGHHERLNLRGDDEHVSVPGVVGPSHPGEVGEPRAQGVGPADAAVRRFDHRHAAPCLLDEDRVTEDGDRGDGFLRPDQRIGPPVGAVAKGSDRIHGDREPAVALLEIGRNGAAGP
ncbi:MAG: hypothetical protein GIKADHBN_03412 [Phycisphaerales bacterium]|nr:hypothetical protein [Phycisphaerales bacterium]